jgi:hypothetical protein
MIASCISLAVLTFNAPPCAASDSASMAKFSVCGPNVTCLGLSGGGVRRPTLNLGILQVLAGAHWLRRRDTDRSAASCYRIETENSAGTMQIVNPLDGSHQDANRFVALEKLEHTLAYREETESG